MPGAEHTFLFADMAGFTVLTEVHGDERAADLAETFAAAVRAVLPEHGAEEVKRIGDATMIRCAAAGEAVRLGVRIVGEIGSRHGAPSVRVGMNTGPAAQRRGDWYGTAVNVAARVSADAAGGEALLTEATRAAAGPLDPIRLLPRGRRALRNIAQPVQLFAAVPEGESSPSGLPVDPVCRMLVDPDHSAGALRHDGAQFHFCSLACAGAFAADPGRYAGGSERGATDGGAGEGGSW